MVANLPLLSAYEAHIVNVTGRIVNDIPTGEFCVAGEPVVELSVISTDTEMANAEIWYTIDYDNDPDDGGDPVCNDPNSILYTDSSFLGTGPFEIDSAATIRAVSCHYRDGELLQSAVASMHYDDALIADCNPTLKINKVYYDVDGEHGRANYSDNEWVELYNPTANSVNIKNWKICDNHNCDTLSLTDLFIPGGGYAVVTYKENTWDYWNIPDNTNIIKIVLNDPIGDGLANAADMLLLKNPLGGGIADQMNWGTPDSGWDNYNSGVWNPGITGVTRGDIVGRSPNGYDTNQVSDWKVFKLPDITEISISPLQAEHCGCCDDEENSCGACPGTCHCAPGLYYSQKLDITWNAETANISGDNELSIDITYIADDDCSGDISSGDGFYTIASGETNDGIYVWDGWEGEWDGTLWHDESGNVIPYFYGLTWIQITATGPENFMMNNSKLSAPMFEPLPQGITIEDICSITEDSSDDCQKLKNDFNSGDSGNIPPVSETEAKNTASETADNSNPTAGGDDTGDIPADNLKGGKANNTDNTDNTDDKNEEKIIAKEEDINSDIEIADGDGNSNKDKYSNSDQQKDEEIIAKDKNDGVDAIANDNDGTDNQDNQDEPIIVGNEKQIKAAADIDGGSVGNGPASGSSQKENGDDNKDGDEKIIAKEEDIATIGGAVVTDGNDDSNKDKDSEDKDNTAADDDKKIVAREEDIGILENTDVKIEEENGGGEDDLNEGEIIEKDVESQVLDSGKYDDNEENGNDGLISGGDNISDGNSNNVADDDGLPIEDDGGSAEIGFSLTPQV